MTIGIIRGEWLKLRRMGITWVLFLVPLVLALLGSTLPVFSAASTARRFGLDQLGDFAELLFPEAMLIGLQIVDFLGGILIILFITAVVGNEYRFDTWKALLARRASRARFLLVKLGYAVVFVTLLTILVPLVFQFGALFALQNALDISIPLNLTSADIQLVGNALILSWLRLVIGISIGLLAATIAQSGGGAVAIALPWMLIDGIVNGLGFFGGLWRGLQPYTFGRNLDAFADYLRGGSDTLTPVHVLIVLLIYTIGISAIAIRIFQRRDIAG